MPTSTDITNLKINKLTEAQYDAAVQGGVIDANELSVLTDVLDPQSDVMPTAGSQYLGQITQYTGATNATYTNGYFYKCTSDGQDPATYSWAMVDVQPAGATIDDTSTSSLTETWSASKLNTMIGDVETLLSQI